MSDSRSRQSLASFDSAEHVAVVPSLVALRIQRAADEVDRARDVVGAARLGAAAKHRRDEVGDAERIARLVVAARLHGDAEAGDRQLLAGNQDDVEAVLQREPLDGRQRQLGRLGRRRRADEVEASRPVLRARLRLARGAARLRRDRNPGLAGAGGLAGGPHAQPAADERQRQQRPLHGLPPGGWAAGPAGPASRA